MYLNTVIEIHLKKYYVLLLFSTAQKKVRGQWSKGQNEDNSPSLNIVNKDQFVGE